MRGLWHGLRRQVHEHLGSPRFCGGGLPSAANQTGGIPHPRTGVWNVGVAVSQCQLNGCKYYITFTENQKQHGHLFRDQLLPSKKVRGDQKILEAFTTVLWGIILGKNMLNHKSFWLRSFFGTWGAKERLRSSAQTQTVQSFRWTVFRSPSSFLRNTTQSHSTGKTWKWDLLFGQSWGSSI